MVLEKRNSTFAFQQSKKGAGTLFGRNDAGLAVVFPDTEVTAGEVTRKPRPGDYLKVKVMLPPLHCRHVVLRLL